ncbi:hypothetical protein GCM10015535_21450 [Streptomyces gelaticus]|uniref:UDP-N-acetylmuramyl pentapeptide phosphotransferase/UDP-N-acetylglucosamine-1-phosphate transferase n=2 Tax=Streptomyces gelaticus TaxID=285446 RepID=A0ABQ2VWD1_9ACTN|nr:hypothetical protein GCM10015535_21450 [Streptomyces gelaticus]
MTAGTVAAAVAGGVYRALRTRPRPRGLRTNYAGRTVDLYAGPAAALGAAAGTAVLPLPARTRCAAALAVLAAGGCGAYDDLVGADDPRRGFRAHLGALRDGEVTSGAVKLFGIGAAGLAAGALLKERPVDRMLAAVVIAGTAHLVNLTDVRPGAAATAVLALGAPGLPVGLAAAPMGAVTALVADDLGERTMLGDTGVHALGAALGVAIVAGRGRAGLLAHAAGLVAAAAYGDRISRLVRVLSER